VTAPVTQSIRLRWRPELCFYDERIPILRAFEDKGVLQAFRVSEETVDAQLPDWTWLSVAQSGLTLDVLTDKVDVEASWLTIETVIEKLGTLHFSHARVSYQHVVELGVSFEDALTVARNRLYPDVGTDAVVISDWALLADLELAGPPPAEGQIEFGIARAWEIPFRLRRAAGRGPGMAHIGEREWVADEFKEPALFADSDLKCKATVGREESFLDDARQFWASSRGEMSRLVAGFRSKFVDDGRDD
jgi:hypothetical protein